MNIFENLDPKVQELIRQFEQVGTISSAPIAVVELERRAERLIEIHKNNPNMYKTTDEWRTGYLHGVYHIIGILHNRGITEV